jgi:putative hydrolase of the HAD superfamily
MRRILFWDIGGVLLTNGWDRKDREEAARLFRFDLAEFNGRHAQAVDAFDCGRMGLDEYLSKTLFYESRDFTQQSFREFMYSRSRAVPDAIAIAADLASRPDCFMAALNNESRPLNAYRIEHFDLRRLFNCFFSSCFLGVRKPDPKLYETALDLMQIKGERVVFIDDREENLGPARQLGMLTVHFKNAAQLRQELASHAGIPF